jgi:acetyl-CoA carboxylase carboxyl transferase subunit beta
MAAEERPTAADVIAAVVDPRSFEPWPTAPDPATTSESYTEGLTRARRRAHTQESVVAGVAQVGGRRVVLVVGEFGFLAGSVGMAAADTIRSAVLRATREGLPILAAPTSGGTRMQEGTPAFLRMVPIAAAVAAHRRAGLAFLVWLRNPTTGGVQATWGSLGQVTAAEPGALVGFLGPRVFSAVFGEEFPPGVQTAENLVRVGVLDAIVPCEGLRTWVERLLAAIVDPDLAAPTEDPGALRDGADDGGRPGVAPDYPVPDAWDCVLATRAADRPGLREFLAAAATEVTILSGTGEGGRDDAILLALARVMGRRTVVVGQDRSTGRAFGPEGLRTARRGYRLAVELGLPLLTVVDTEGAELSASAEEGAMAGEIARSLAELSELPTRVVALLLGSGCGGGALSMLPADWFLAASDSWITPLPPEGASAIVHRTVERAPEMARQQQITAVQLAHLGVIDVLVGTPDTDHSAFLQRCGREVAAGLATSGPVPTPRRVDRFVVAP